MNYADRHRMFKKCRLTKLMPKLWQQEKSEQQSNLAQTKTGLSFRNFIQWFHTRRTDKKLRCQRHERRGRNRHVNTTDSAGDKLYGRTHLRGHQLYRRGRQHTHVQL